MPPDAREACTIPSEPALPRKTRVGTLVEQVTGEIAAGRLAVSARLPSIREAAAASRLSRNTIVDAYERLASLGLIEARRGSGFYVRGKPAERAAFRAPHVAEAIDVVSLLREQLYRHCEVRVGDGRPPLSWMEGSELGRHLRHIRLPASEADGASGEHEYGNPWGYTPLRERIAALLQERAIKASSQQVLLTHGANHALDLIVRHLITAGDKVLVDSPGYYPLFGKLKLAKARMIGVARRPDGPDPDDLEAKAVASGARVFFTQSLAHNPTGGSLNLPVAQRLLRIAARHDLTIVEDDPFADLLPPTSVRLSALDQLERVIYVSSFSKTLSASLRVGFVAAPRAVADALCDLKTVTVVSTSTLIERMVHQLIVGGHYRRHLRRLSARLTVATGESLAALRHLGLQVDSPQHAGYYAWARLPDRFDERSLARRAATEGIFLAPGCLFMPDRDAPVSALRINVAYGADPRFIDFIRRAMNEG